MRLLHSTTLKLHEFLGSQIPPYAILSHTWGEEEVSFQDLQAGNTVQKKGFEKIKRCCEIADLDGFEYAWVDTCCIDKTSSAELSEAINSMYRWYRQAEVCYAFLSDVPSDEDPRLEESAFRKSRWFTRGWTLQELIAPLHVQFLGGDWKDIGTKLSLQEVIFEITNIQSDALVGNWPMAAFSVAQKMSWASNRQTTRDEDIAYCMMGIFNINMPLLYGEGGKAFIRLQEQIMTTSEDDSIFAWWSEKQYEGWGQGGLLALSPKAFSRSGNVVGVSMPDFPSKFSWTGSQIRWEAPVLHSNLPSEKGILVMLKCRSRSNDDKGSPIFAIRLEVEDLPMVRRGSVMKRVEAHIVHTIPESNMHLLEKKSMSIWKVSFNIFDLPILQYTTTQAFHFRFVGLQQRQIISLEAYPLDHAHPEERISRLSSSHRVNPMLGIRLKDISGVVFDVMLIIKPYWGSVLTAFIVEPSVDETLKDVVSSFINKNEGIHLEAGYWDQSKPPRVLPETSDRVFWRHFSGAQTTLTIKKINRQREPKITTPVDDLMFERMYVRSDGYNSIVTEDLVGTVDAQVVNQRYLIQVKLE